MKNLAKDKILNNELCLGVGLRQTRTVDIGKIMATCDYDWLFIDIRMQPMDGMAYYYRGLAHVSNNQLFRGCGDFDKAYQLNVLQYDFQ